MLADTVRPLKLVREPATNPLVILALSTTTLVPLKVLPAMLADTFKPLEPSTLALLATRLAIIVLALRFPCTFNSSTLTVDMETTLP